MQYDLIIRNGNIVDGTGAPAFSGDVAIKDGKIAAVGDFTGSATRKIDAKGNMVAPGWVDSHSHMDGQATWDPYCSPASNHGITTLVMGNCGIGFAPCKRNEAAHQALIEVVEDVEDIPGAALNEGISWNWESFPEYLDEVDKMPRAVDVAAQVPHCAVRTYVMGERGAKNEKATPEDIEKMAAIVKESLEAGAVGFSTSRTLLHRSRNGGEMPGTYADEAELMGIGRVLGEIGKGVYQLVSDWDHWELEMDWMKRLSIETKRPITFTIFYRSDEEWARVLKQLEYVKQANAEGAQLIPHVGARPVSVLMSLDGTFNPFSFHQNYGELGTLDRDERIAKLRDPEVRAAILGEGDVRIGDDFVDRITHEWSNMFPLGDQPDYEPRIEDSIAALAEKAGVTPAEYAYDTLLERDGKRMLYFPIFGYEQGDLSRQIAMLKDENTVISLADTGAHCGVLCDASMPTWMLSYLVRDRERGEKLNLEWAVSLHTQKTAQSSGLLDRGTLQPGMKADINIIDFEKIDILTPEVIFDLPAGGRRVFQDAVGYLATIVGGEVIYENGKPTGAMPGKLVRGSQAAPQGIA